jgi:hypothetical protein
LDREGEIVIQEEEREGKERVSQRQAEEGNRDIH